MADQEKLNVDSIIGRLLEGIFRNVPIDIKTEFVVNDIPDVYIFISSSWF